MKVSVFPKVLQHLPTSKEEKAKNAKLAIQTQEVSVRNFDELIELVHTSTWSPALFNGDRKKDNFRETFLMVLDIDEGMTVEQAEEIIDNMRLKAVIMPTASHTPEAHRFRVLFPLSERITRERDFDATWDYLSEMFPSLDANCKDTSRFYFGCKAGELIINEDSYSLLQPKRGEGDSGISNGVGRVVKVGQYQTEDALGIIYPGRTHFEFIPESIDTFLTIGPKGGINERGDKLWWRSLNDFVFTISILGKTLEETIDLVSKIAPEDLDETDLTIIEKAHNDGEKYRD